MQKEQVHLLIGIVTPLLLVAALLIQLRHGQQNLTQAIVSLHTGRVMPEEAPDEAQIEIPQPEAKDSEPDKPDNPVPQPLPQPLKTAVVTPVPPPAKEAKSMPEARPLPGELLEDPELTTNTNEAAVHLTYQPITINHIYPRLQPFGRWFVHPRHGNVWMPDASRRDSKWRPYAQNGQWYYTQTGWHWQSNYKWGGTTFHHGRWFWDQGHNGWLWVPGREWSPAWVSWREHEDKVGWAPIPPLATASSSPTPSSRPTGTSGVHIDYGLDSSHFTFVPKIGFLAENPYDFVLNEEDALEAFENSRSRDRIAITGQRRWANFGIPRREMAKAIGNPIEIVAVDLRNPYQPRIVTMADIEAAAQTSTDSEENSDPNGSPSLPSTQQAAGTAPGYYPANQRFRRGFGGNPVDQTGNYASPAPIVINGSTATTNDKQRTQTANPSGLGIRRGQARPNLSVRQQPTGR